MQPLPYWAQLLSALLTPTIAIAVTMVAYLQWRTNQNKLKLDLFDRRYRVFVAVNAFLSNVFQHGAVKQEALRAFSEDTASVRFLFNEAIGEYIWSIEKRAYEMLALQSELKEMPVGDERTKTVAQHSSFLKLMLEEHNGLVKKFAPFLQLSH